MSPSRLVLVVTIAASLAGGAGCNAVNDIAPSSGGGETSPTPAFSNQTYAAALRVASIRLRATVPSAADTGDVLANGAPAYDALVEKWLDPAQNPALTSQLRAFYSSVFLLGEPAGGTGSDPVNYSAAADMATRLFETGAPWTEMLTADYCVDDSLSQVTCPTGSAPTAARAGFITDMGFLKAFGPANTFNFRRTSVVHQVFDCAVYPGVPDSAAWKRTNLDPSQWGCDKGANGADDGDGGVQPCMGDDLPDPQVIASASDPAGNRVSKRYQGYQFGLGMACATGGCHGSLLPRRGVFTPYTTDGSYDPLRTIDSVETIALVGADYCGTQTPSNPADDLDPGAQDCAAGYQPSYNGVTVSTPRDMADQILAEPAFYGCATTRAYDFVLGLSQGAIGLQAGGGTPPAALDDAAETKFETLYRSSGWNTRDLVRTIFESSEFLSAQAAANP